MIHRLRLEGQLAEHLAHMPIEPVPVKAIPSWSWA